MGYGIVEAGTGADPLAVTWGVISARPRLPLGERLHCLYQELLGLMERYVPEN